MSGRVSLSRRSAVEIRDYLHGRASIPAKSFAIAELEHALTPRKPRPLAVASRKVKAEKKASKREQRADVRALVMARAEANGNLCECGCGRVMDGEFILRPTLDHYFGRARAESVETCWAIAEGCHYLKSNNVPSASAWIERFITHAEKHGYTAEAERARARLEGICAIRRAEAER